MTKESQTEEEEVVIPSKEELLNLEEEQEDGSSEEQEKEYSEIELAAIESGWNPEGVEGKRNLSAEEFIDRQKLYDDIHSLKRQVKRAQGDVENLTKYQDRIREDERKKVIKELKDAKKIALENEDYDTVVEIDEQILDAKQGSKKEDVKKQDDNPIFDTWVENNKWYEDDSELRILADGLGIAYMNNNPDKDLKDAYSYVSKEIKKVRPDKFENTRRQAPNSVETGKRTTTRKTKSKYSASDLPEEELSIMRTILRTTKMTEEEYLKEYFS